MTLDMDLKDVYDELSELIICLNADDNILAVNKSAHSFFSKFNPIGKNYLLAFQENDVVMPSDPNQQYDWKTINKARYKYLIGRKKIQETPENFLNNLLNASHPNIFVYWTDKEHHLLLCNDTLIKYLGAVNMCELRGKSIADLTLLTEKSQNYDTISTLLQNNLRVMEERRPFTFEEQVGDKFYFSYKAPFYDVKGNVIGILGISTDITENQKLQNELKKSKHATDFYLESILMSSLSNIYWLDKEGQAIGCNDQQARVVGLNSRHDIIGTTVFDLAKRLNWDPKLPHSIREHDLSVMRTKQPSISLETAVLNGEEKFYIASKSPLLDENAEPIGILGISTDITTQIQIEKQLEIAKNKAETANKAKTQFLANITHDIRTPLISIHGIANWLQEHIPAEFDNEIKNLIQASKEIISLLNNIIELTKLEIEDKNTIVNGILNLRELLQRLKSLFVPIMQQKNIKLEIFYPDDIPSCFFTSHSLIEQIILNLLSNAFKFTEKGHVKLYVTTKSNETVHSKCPLIIKVEDTGCGISKEYLDKIFESFFQLNPAYKSQYYSSGLGLAIVKKSLYKLGGSIQVESAPGKGSIFYVNLPLTVSHKGGEPIEVAEQSLNYANILKKPKKLSISQYIDRNKKIISVLLIEDNSLIQKIAVSLLNKFNVDVEIADNATNAINMIVSSNRTYDIIFLDIGLPDQDGFWVSSQIRKKHPSYNHVPIIALTAHLDQNHQDVCLRYGISDVITKPLTFENAKDCLKRFHLLTEKEY